MVPLLESTGLRWNLVDSAGLLSGGIRWTLLDSCLVEIPLDSAGVVQRKNMTEFRGLHQNIPDSAGLLWTKHANLALVTLKKSR